MISGRVQRLRERLGGSGCDAVLVNQSVNVRYLTGFDGVFDEEPASVALVTADEALLLADSRYVEAIAERAEGTEWVAIRADDDVWADALAAVEDRGLRNLALESSVSHARFVDVESRLAGDVSPAARWVESLRIVKDAEELHLIEEAAAVTDAAFEHIVPVVAPGVTERAVALDLEFWVRTHGAEDVAFAPIVASGPNSALPHAHATDREIQRGDLVKLDFGARVGGYCADMTRTVVIGPASQRQRTIYNAVLEANETGLRELRAGRTGAEIDAVARAVLEDRGLAELFGHGLGHGVGLDVHELPTLSRRGTNPVPACAVVTIEPGVYEPGLGGVRIEDLVTVEEDGCRRLTNSPKQLIEL